MATSIALIEATQSDAPYLFTAINDPELRGFSEGPAKLTRKEFEQWFYRTDAKRYRLLLLVRLPFERNDRAGFIRWEANDWGEAWLSVYIESARRRKGLAKSSLDNSIAIARKRFPKHALRAKVLESNRASIALLAKTGFRVLHRGGGPPPSLIFEREDGL